MSSNREALPVSKPGTAELQVFLKILNGVAGDGASRE
jgi:hypothetical protein